jgi:hypothetical protein
MQDIDELNHGKTNAQRLVKGDEEEEEVETSLWEPSGTWWKDFLYFSGPGT